MTNQIPPKSTKWIISADTGKRVWNMIIDAIMVFIIIELIATILNINSNDIYTTGGDSTMLGIIALFYYLIAETVFWKTVWKAITKTKVIDINWKKPGFLKILWRTLCRCIPIDFISFLFGPNPRWRHDSIPWTYVVDDKIKS